MCSSRVELALVSRRNACYEEEEQKREDVFQDSSELEMYKRRARNDIRWKRSVYSIYILLLNSFSHPQLNDLKREGFLWVSCVWFVC